MSVTAIHVLTFLGILLWAGLWWSYPFLKRYRVLKTVATARRRLAFMRWTCLGMAVGLQVAHRAGVALPGWVTWAGGAWAAIGVLSLPAVVRLRREIAIVREGKKIRAPIAPKELFISYNRETAEYARQLWERLTALGIRTWFAECELLIDGRAILADPEELRTILGHGIWTSARCVFLVSPRALQSPWVMGTEVRLFRQREALEDRPIIQVMLTGESSDLAREALPDFLQDRQIIRWPEGRDVDDVLPALLNELGLKDRFRPRDPARPMGVLTRRSGELHSEIRKFRYSFELKPFWRTLGFRSPRQPKSLFKQLMSVVNVRTHMRLNLVVGPMPPGFVDSDEEALPNSVETENLFAERMFQSPGADMRTVLASHLINVPWSGGPAPVDSQGRPVTNKPHFAFTYRSLGVYHRKYALLVRPGADAKHFEFAFTAYRFGSLARFLECIAEVDDIVRSFRIEESQPL